MSGIVSDRRRIGCDEHGHPLVGEVDEHRRFHIRFRAQDADIDELGHVNNAVWVQWIQEVALAHWYSVADPVLQDAYIWVVVRHEIDYLRAVVEGETVTGRTWVGEAPKGARFDRHVKFVGADGKVKVEAVTTWAIIDREAGRIIRVPKHLAALFLS